MMYRLRISLTLLWTLMATATACFALLKASPTAHGLSLLPRPWAHWLDQNYDIRTLLMTLVVLMPAAMLLGTKSLCKQRRICLSLLTAGLVALEFLQLTIPTRVFSVPDLLYTLVGGILAEGTGWSTQTIDENYRS